jgi:hypothetical protein
MSTPYDDVPMHNPQDESDTDYIECPVCGGYSAAHRSDGDALCEHCGARLPSHEID